MSTYLKIIKVAAVASIAATITIASYNFAYFENIRADAYGIWHGFPFGYYFGGTFIDKSLPGIFPSWLPLHFWRVGYWALDCVIWFLLVGSVLLLIELGLKKLLKIEW